MASSGSTVLLRVMPSSDLMNQPSARLLMGRWISTGCLASPAPLPASDLQGLCQFLVVAIPSASEVGRLSDEAFDLSGGLTQQRGFTASTLDVFLALWAVAQSTFVLLLCGNSGHAEDGVRYRPFRLRSHWYCLDQLQFRRA